jgi:hypothetical protein
VCATYFDCCQQFEEVLCLVPVKDVGLSRISTTVFGTLVKSISCDYSAIQRYIQCASHEVDRILPNRLVKIRVKFLWLGYSDCTH